MSGRLLVVEDDPGAAELTTRIFNRASFQVTKAEGLSDAMFQIVSADPHFDAVLLMFSVAGPGAAVELVQNIRGHADEGIASSTIVALGYPGKTHVDLWQAGVDGFIYRPPHELDLLAEVGAAMDRPAHERATHRAKELEAARATSGPQ